MKALELSVVGGIIVWLVLTIIAIIISGDIFKFVKGSSFVVLILGWIILLSIWPILKKLGMFDE